MRQLRRRLCFWTLFLRFRRWCAFFLFLWAHLHNFILRISDIFADFLFVCLFTFLGDFAQCYFLFFSGVCAQVFFSQKILVNIFDFFWVVLFCFRFFWFFSRKILLSTFFFGFSLEEQQCWNRKKRSNNREKNASKSCVNLIKTSFTSTKKK